MYQHKFSVLGNTQTLYYKKKLEGKQQTNKTEQQKKGKSAIKKKFLAAFCENLQSSTSSHLRHAHYKLKNYFFILAIPSRIVANLSFNLWSTSGPKAKLLTNTILKLNDMNIGKDNLCSGLWYQ